jgi:DNA-binding helix-hairpin-helix protein with protein kinase domain
MGVIFSLVLAAPALAQVNPQFADVSDEIEMIRSLVRVERKAAIEQAMQLAPTESQAFWSLYNEYEAEKTKVNDRAVKVVTDYAAAYPDVGDERAAALLSESFAADSDLLSLKKKYARRFAKVLPPARVARFFQIERKLDVVQNLSLAEQIPLIDR